MKTRLISVTLISMLCITSAPSMAGGSAEASAQAAAHSMEAIGYAVEGGFKLAAGAIAVPLQVVGGIGKASGEVGDDLWREANSPPHTPLPLTDEVITIRPGPTHPEGEAAGPSPREQFRNTDKN